MSRESRKLKRQQRKAASKESWARKRKEEPGAFWTYFILRTIVILILIRSIWIGQYDNAIVCVYVLVLYVLPQFVENRMNIEIPSILEIIIFVFVFLAEILGELESFFLKVTFGTPCCTPRPASCLRRWASRLWTCSTAPRR